MSSPFINDLERLAMNLATLLDKEMASKQQVDQIVDSFAKKHNLNAAQSKILHNWAQTLYDRRNIPQSPEYDPFTDLDMGSLLFPPSRNSEEAERNIYTFLQSNIDVQNRLMYMGESNVNWALTTQISKALYSIDHYATDTSRPIKIIMNNQGGDYYLGMAIYDIIKACRSPVHIYVFGQSMSMGALILQAASKRVISKNARIMIHAGYLGLSANHPEINKRWMDQYNKDEYYANKILADRIIEKHGSEMEAVIEIQKLLISKTDKKDDIAAINALHTVDAGIREMVQFDMIFTPEEAIAIGLADEILSSMEELEG